MYPYAIGLDIGITSVGWATVALDEEDKPYGIIGMGARIFDAAEHPKNGASLAAPRREARSSRRRLRRRHHRKERIKELFVKEKLLSEDQLNHLYNGQLSDIYKLRVEALDRIISDEEFARVLLHLAQRRGFRSNRKNASSKEDGELLTAVSENQNRMAEKGYRTIGEMYYLDPVYKEYKRNKAGKYIATVSRDMIEGEAHLIFSAQRKYGNAKATEKLEESYLNILLSQRSFDEGPGEGSPYAGNQIERMIGKCSFEPNEMRAAKATYSFEYFSLLESINHIKIITSGTGNFLTKEQRFQIIELSHKKPNLNYYLIRKALCLTEEQTFNMVSYSNDATQEESEKKTKFNHLKAYHQMRVAYDKIAKNHFSTLTIEQRNTIGQVLSIYKTSAKIRPALLDAGLTEIDIDVAETLSFSKFGHLSVRACNKIIPYLEEGLKYSEACEAAGYSFKGHDKNERQRLLPALNEEAKNTLTSPVVLRAVSQAIKVINAIIRERGCSPTYINIELAREMARDFVERNKIKKEQEENRAKNDRMMDRIRTEYGKASPSGQDLVKLKLYEEQGGVCAYSLQQMSLEKLFDLGYAEVDHIIPYSISFDDSYKNKVLVLSKENRDKADRLPLQYLTGKRRDDFIVWTNTCVRDYKKRQNLLKESISEEEKAGFKERNLQDTKTASRFLMNYINDYLEFSSFKTGRKKHVTAVNGSVTAYLRKRWGISKVRANGDLHHAVDALVIACTTDGMIQAVTKYNRLLENRYKLKTTGRYLVDPETGEVVKEFPFPWPKFRQELEVRLGDDPKKRAQELGLPLYLDNTIQAEPLFVSRMPRHKVTGAAHKDTIKSPKAIDQGRTVVKKSLSELKLDQEGEIANYYEPQSDQLLYEALKTRLHEFNGKAKYAFSEPFYKPRKDGSPGPLVNKVKVYEPTTLSVAINGGKGVADNESMVRIDVFYLENEGYYFVPIYVADTLKKELPIKACVAHKAYRKWKEMKEEDFMFSLFPNDLIKVTHKKDLLLKISNADSNLPDSYETKSEMLYYVKANTSGGSIYCQTHDGAYIIQSLGIKTLESIQKYTVDVLGNYSLIKKEKRRGFSR